MMVWKEESGICQGYFGRNVREIIRSGRGYYIFWNPGLNSLIKVKVAKARKKGIEMTVKAFVPKRMSISFGDMGVIYGNLIDNAIEASMKMQREKAICGCGKQNIKMGNC